MSGDRLRGSLAELVAIIQHHCSASIYDLPYVAAAMTRARALLAEAQPVSPPEPVRPSERIASIAAQALECALAWEPDARLIGNVRAEDIADLCSAVIAGLRPAPEPVSVDQRPWERKGWCDADGRCWLFGKVEGDWRLMSATNSGLPSLKYCFSHALPHWALPVPQEQADG